MHSVFHVCQDWPVISIYTLCSLLSTIHACGSIQFIHLSALSPPPPPPPPHLPFTTGFVIAFIFQAVETLLATSSAVSNAANLDTGLRTADPCPGWEVTSPLATILSLESPTTSQPQANQLNQSNDDALAQVHQFTQDYELESGHSLRVKGNLKNNLVFWRSIGAPDFILPIIENGYRLPFISFPLAVKLKNNKSARIYADFVDQAVLELLNSDRVRMVSSLLL